MNADRYDAWKTATPEEYIDCCDQCGESTCDCEEIDDGDAKYDMWKDEGRHNEKETI